MSEASPSPHLAPDPARLRPLLADPALAALLSLLDGEGEEARIVGGAVRDGLIGAPVADVDVATTAPPDEVVRRLQSMGWRAIPTGIDHGTVTALIEGRTFEVTSLREDVETFGRKAKVRFGRDFRADAFRRDFTINALSLDRAGQVHDYAGGLEDLAARRVRFIGEAAGRIREDYLRILRFFRFHARFGAGPLDAQGMAAAIALREGLDGLSRERVRAEVLKLLVAPGAAQVAAQIDAAGFWAQIAGGVGDPARLAALAAEPTLEPAGPDAVLRLAALAVGGVEDAARLRERLRLSNDEAARLEEAARALCDLRGREAPTREETRALLFAHGRRAACDALVLAALDAASEAKSATILAARLGREEAIPVPPFGGADLLARGLPSGRLLGAALKRLQADWIRAGFPTDPAALARLMDGAVAAARDGI